MLLWWIESYDFSLESIKVLPGCGLKEVLSVWKEKWLVSISQDPWKSVPCSHGRLWFYPWAPASRLQLAKGKEGNYPALCQKISPPSPPRPTKFGAWNSWQLKKGFPSEEHNCRNALASQSLDFTGWENICDLRRIDERWRKPPRKTMGKRKAHLEQGENEAKS